MLALLTGYGMRHKLLSGYGMHLNSLAGYWIRTFLWGGVGLRNMVIGNFSYSDHCHFRRISLFAQFLFAFSLAQHEMFAYHSSCSIIRTPCEGVYHRASTVIVLIDSLCFIRSCTPFHIAITLYIKT